MARVTTVVVPKPEFDALVEEVERLRKLFLDTSGDRAVALADENERLREELETNRRECESSHIDEQWRDEEVDRLLAAEKAWTETARVYATNDADRQDEVDRLREQVETLGTALLAERAERDAAVDALAAVQAEVHRVALDALAEYDAGGGE